MIPDELIKLLEFENSVAKDEFYSSGFQLRRQKKNMG